MRICILTQPLGSNYGALLQAYALQKVLRDMGHDVTTLRFKPPLYRAPSKRNLYWQTFRRFLSRLRGNKSIIRCNPTKQSEYFYEVNRELERFIESNINYTRVNPPIQPEDLPPFDLYIVGSDQVWRPAYSPCLTNFYLDFLQNQKAKRIAYAASFGVDFWEADEKTTAIIKPLAKLFDCVTVREQSGIELCKHYLQVDASLMPDPTLLLTRLDYYELCKSATFDRGTPYIATYILDKSDRINELVESYAKEKGLPVREIGSFNWETGAESVERWLYGLANARCVITDSFHGTVFSLLFQKEFITLKNVARGASRFLSLLETVQLEDRLLDIETTQKIRIDPIDYPEVDKKLMAFREKGLLFLKKHV